MIALGKSVPPFYAGHHDSAGTVEQHSGKAQVKASFARPLGPTRKWQLGFSFSSNIGTDVNPRVVSIKSLRVMLKVERNLSYYPATTNRLKFL